jgi:hypothetical protein
MQSTGVFQDLLNAFSAALLPGAQALHELLLLLIYVFILFELMYVVYKLLWGVPVMEELVRMLILAMAVGIVALLVLIAVWVVPRLW